MTSGTGTKKAGTKTLADVAAEIRSDAVQAELRSGETKTYRRLLRAAHPDVWPGEEAEAQEVLQLVLAAWRKEGGAALTVSSSTTTYTTTGESRNHGLGETFPVTWGSGTERMTGYLSSGSSDVADLYQKEVQSLVTLMAGEEKWQAYVPDLVEAWDDADGTHLVYGAPAGVMTVQEIMERNPRGIDPRDAAWMLRRILVALGYTARCDLVHGAVLPESIGILPVEHGVVLLNWQMSTWTGEKVPAVVESRRRMYPPEILSGKPAGPGSDIYTAAESVRALIGEQMVPPIEAFLNGCTVKDNHRPQDAWALLKEFDELLERLYGKRRFRVFTP